MRASLSIGFHGAARTVTGSRHLIRFGDWTALFDCGLYQGRRDEADRVNRTFRFAPADVDCVIASHAHLDHTGNLPTLVSQGYGGPIHMTAATADLSRVMLPDSAFLMEKDLEHVNKRRGARPERKPLYTMADVESVLARIETHRYHEHWSPHAGVDVQYWDAGHILGSAMTTLEFKSNGRTFRLGMGGDLGRPARPILRDPETLAGLDALVMESTYGDRLHADARANEEDLVAIVNRTVERGGKLIVPAFAVGRTQELVAVLHDLIERGRVPELPMFVDSPMARAATAVFRRHPECFDAPTRELFERGDGEPFGFSRLTYVGSADESRALNTRPGPLVVISASGMCEGGRVLHHLMHSLGDAKNTVMFVGYQGEGTLGRRLQGGAATVNVFGEPVTVRAEVTSLDGFSAHADQREILEWVARLMPVPPVIYLVHGDLEPATTLAGLLHERFGVRAVVPGLGEEFDLWT
jgi:metallo-beta-lactamase family protein